MTGIHITHCVCRGVPFTTLRDQARREAWTLAELMAQTGCGDQCGLCRPYLRVMLADGTTEFRALLPPDPTGPEGSP